MDETAHLKHLQVILKEFNFVAAYNKNILIWYFWDSLCPSIQVQAKASQQLLSGTWEIDAWCLYSPRPVKTEVKPLKKKSAKSSYSFFANLESQAGYSSFI